MSGDEDQGPSDGTDLEALARKYYDRMDADDYEAVFDLFADDVTYHRPGQEPIQGIEALREFYLEERPLADGEHVVESVVVDDDEVAVQGRYVGSQDGEAVEFGWADFHVFEDGVIVDRTTFTDRDEV